MTTVPLLHQQVSVKVTGRGGASLMGVTALRALAAHGATVRNIDGVVNHDAVESNLFYLESCPDWWLEELAASDGEHGIDPDGQAGSPIFWLRDEDLFA